MRQRAVGGAFLVVVLFVGLGFTQNPAKCPIGRWQTDTNCIVECPTDCVGGLCSSRGNCIYEDCRKSYTYYKIDGCRCTYVSYRKRYRCQFAQSAPTQLSLTESRDGIIAIDFHEKNSDDDQDWTTDSWIENPSGELAFKQVRGTPPISFIGGEIHIVCISKIQGGKYPNPACAYLKTTKKPIAEENIFLEGSGDRKTFINYTITIDERSNCSITVENRKTNLKIPCQTPNGAVEIHHPKRGRKYNVGYEVCNSRGCAKFSGIEKWTHPGTPSANGTNITRLSSTENNMVVTIPDFGDSLHGEVYLLIVEDSQQVLSLNMEDARDYVKENKFPDNVLVEKLALTVRQYDLSSDVLKKKGVVGGIFMSCVAVFEAGPYKTYGATPFFGPFEFSTRTESHVTSVLIGVLLITLLLVLSYVALRSRKLTNLLLKPLSKFNYVRGLITSNNPGAETTEVVRPPTPPPLPLPDLSSTSRVNTTPLPPIRNAENNQQNDGPENLPNNERNPLSVESTNRVKTTPLPPIPNAENNQQNEGTENLPNNERNSLSVENDSLLQDLPSFCHLVNYSDDDYINVEQTKSYESSLEYYLIQVAHSPALQYEFMDIPSSVPGLFKDEGMRQENQLKNRYGNNLPYDETRVILPTLPGNLFSDYINASLIQKSNNDSQSESLTYIASQAPPNNPNTISDFWRMIWYNNVDAIVMLTNFTENGKIKCSQYWPEAGRRSDYADDISVVEDNVQIMHNFVIRTFIVSKENEDQKVYQYHYTDWPDFGVPLIPSPLIFLIQVLRANHRRRTTVVHCSAGFGRTGCLLLILLCLEDVASARPLSLKDNLLALRNSRPNLVQNVVQYRFCHYVLWLILFERAKTLSPTEFLLQSQRRVHGGEQYHAAADFDPTLVAEFKKLKTYPKDLTYTIGMDEQIRKKYNRFVNVLPADSRRVTLTSNVTNNFGDDYVNAIWMDGFDRKDAYIVAESPTWATIGRLWLMVLEKRIPAWILLNQSRKGAHSGDTEPSVIPSDLSTTSYDLATVEVVSFDEYPYYEEVHVRIYSNQESDESWECSVIQFYGWFHPDISPESGPESLLALLDYARSKASSMSPLLFSCTDGFTACGLALALDLALDAVRTLREVNVFGRCVDITYTRPEFVVSLDQYKMIYKYLASFLLIEKDEPYYSNDIVQN